MLCSMHTCYSYNPRSTECWYLNILCPRKCHRHRSSASCLFWRQVSLKRGSPIYDEQGQVYTSLDNFDIEQPSVNDTRLGEQDARDSFSTLPTLTDGVLINNGTDVNSSQGGLSALTNKKLGLDVPEMHSSCTRTSPDKTVSIIHIFWWII